MPSVPEKRTPLCREHQRDREGAGFALMKWDSVTFFILIPSSGSWSDLTKCQDHLLRLVEVWLVSLGVTALRQRLAGEQRDSEPIWTWHSDAQNWRDLPVHLSPDPTPKQASSPFSLTTVCLLARRCLCRKSVAHGPSHTAEQLSSEPSDLFTWNGKLGFANQFWFFYKLKKAALMTITQYILFFPLLLTSNLWSYFSKEKSLLLSRVVPSILLPTSLFVKTLLGN